MLVAQLDQGRPALGNQPRKNGEIASDGAFGIDRSNAGEAIAAGADGVAVISALSLKDDPRAAARDLRAVVARALAQQGR